MNLFKIHRKTHIETVRESHCNLMDNICDILSWTQEDFCNHQFAEYEGFARLVARDYPAYRERIRYSPVFRGFFNNEWAKRNELNFMPFAVDSAFSKLWILDEYLYMNDAEVLWRDEAFYIRFESILKHI